MKLFAGWVLVFCMLLMSRMALGADVTDSNTVSTSPEPFNIEAEVHYQVLPIPVDTLDDNKIEVVEVFSYACIHCFHFDPAIEAWRQKQAEDVAFRRLPAIFNQSWALFAQAYYTAETLGVLDQVHAPIFNAIHLQGDDLRNPNAMAKLFKDVAGVDEKEFTRVFNSFGVRSRVQQADAQGRMYRVTGVPSMIVAGKYRVDGKMAGNNTRMLQVVDYLVAKERAEKHEAPAE